LLEARIDVHQAALGADIEVPTLESKVRLKIPAGTQPGKVFRLKGKGIRDLYGRGVGDQLVRVNVEIPEKLSAAERKLLEEYGKLRSGEGQAKNIFSRWRTR